MSLDWRNQYCENDYITKATYRFNRVPINLPMSFLTELEQIILHSQSNLGKEDWSWRTQPY